MLFLAMGSDPVRLGIGREHVGHAGTGGKEAPDWSTTVEREGVGRTAFEVVGVDSSVEQSDWHVCG